MRNALTILNGYRLPIKGKTKMYAFGDSITAGYTYPGDVATHFGLTLTNLAVSGEGLPRMAKHANQGSFSNDGIVTTAAGRNDLAFLWLDYTKVPNYGKWSHCVVLANQFRGTFYKANDATKTGTWTTVDKTAESSKYTDCQQSTTGTSYLEFSVTGTDFVVVMIGSDTTNSTGRFKIFVDGVEKYDITATDNFYEWNYYPGVNGALSEVPGGFPLLGLSAGAHTVRVERISGTIVCDYVVGLADPDTCGAVVISDIIDTVGSAVIPTLRASVISLIKQFESRDYPVKYLPINNYWLLDGSMNPGPDTVHPNQQGQDCFASAFKSQFR